MREKIAKEQKEKIKEFFLKKCWTPKAIALYFGVSESVVRWAVGFRQTKDGQCSINKSSGVMVRKKILLKEAQKNQRRIKAEKRGKNESV